MSFDVCLQGKRLNLTTNMEGNARSTRGSNSATSAHTIVNIPHSSHSSHAVEISKKKEIRNETAVYTDLQCLGQAQYYVTGIIALSICLLLYTQFFHATAPLLPNAHLFNIILLFVTPYLSSDYGIRSSTHVAVSLGTALTGSLFDLQHVPPPVIVSLYVLCFWVLYCNRTRTGTVGYAVFVLGLFTATLCFIVGSMLLPAMYTAWLQMTGVSILICVASNVVRRAS